MTPKNASEQRALDAVREIEAWKIAQLAATMAAAEVASSGPEMFFDKADYKRLVGCARALLREARRQAAVAAEMPNTGPVPVYDLDNLPSGGIKQPKA